jgi:hypothetical protein
VRAGRQRHADVANRRREDGTDNEEQRPSELHAEPAMVHGQDQQHEEHEHGEHGQRAELPVQIRSSAFLDGGGDFAHLRRALIGGQHLPNQHVREGEGSDGDQGDHHDDALLAARNSRRGSNDMPRHAQISRRARMCGARRNPSGHLAARQPIVGL